MRPERGPPSNAKSLNRTFPTKRKLIPPGRYPAGHGKGENYKGKRGGGKNAVEDAKKDPFLSNIFNKENIEDTEDMKTMVYRKCYLLLHGIARVQKGELKWNNKCKDSLFFSQVNLPYLEAAINPAHAENELDSHLVASYSLFKFLIATCGLLDDRSTFINLLLKSTESELGRVAIPMNDLLLAFATAFGSFVAASGREVVHSRKQQTFNETRRVVCLQLTELLEGMGSRRIECCKEKALPSSLDEMYGEIEKMRPVKKGTRKVFESSDEDEQEGGSSQMIKQEVKEEKEEAPKRDVNKQVEKSMNMSLNELNEDEEEEDNQYSKPSTSSSMASDSDEFRSNLVDLAKEKWSKCVAMFAVKKVPSVKERFEMAGYIIECLENIYGEELIEILQYFTIQSFDPEGLKKKEEVIGLLLYLDQRMFIAESFFFLLLAMNDKENVRSIIEESEMCCRAQLKAARIGRKVLLGKPLQVELLMAKKEAASLSKGLESAKYHIFFPGIIEKTTMKDLMNMKKGEDRVMQKEGRLKCAFVEEFWTTSSKFFNVDSEWSTHEVNQSAVRVFEEMNNMFGGTLIGLIRTISGRKTIPDSILKDPRTGASLIALKRMKSAGFFDSSLLFALLRFDDATAMKKSLNKLSRLCDGFTKVVEAGSKSKSLKTDSHFMSTKDNFVERAKKVNADCMPFFEVLMGTKGRKRLLSKSSTGEYEEEKVGKEREPKRKMRKEMMDEEEEGDSMKNKKKRTNDEERNDTDNRVILKKIKEEQIEEEGGRKKKKKVKREETSDNDCKILEVEKKKVKEEVMSDQEEEKEKEKEKKKEKKRKRRESSRCADGDESKKKEEEQPHGENDVNRVVKEEVVGDGEGETHSSVGWISMEIGEGDMDEVDEETRTNRGGFLDLTKVREMLTGMSGYWSKGLKMWNVVSIPSLDDRFKIAKLVIKFYEEQFGEEFHNCLFYRTLVRFTPSDLQEKEEVIGLVLYLDRIYLSMAYFFFFIIAMNDDSKVFRILSDCKDTLHVHLKYQDVVYRTKKGENNHGERNQMKKGIARERKKLTKKLPYYFGDICKAYNSEEGQLLVYGMGRKLSKMKNTPYTDTLWDKYAKNFGVKCEWTLYEVCQKATLVFNELNTIFRGSLISNWNTICSSKLINVSLIDNCTRDALNALIHLHRIKIFPDGLVFLLLQCTNDKVLKDACSLLTGLVHEYTSFFRDFGPEFNYKGDSSKIKDRSNGLMNHEGSLKCMHFLLNNIKQLNGTRSSFASIPSSDIPLEGSTPTQDESVWRYNNEWKVTTLWSQSNEWKEWEKRHSSDMERLTDRMDNFMLASVMREEHYVKKMKVFDGLKRVLKDEMEKTESTLYVVGSSPCGIGAANSNLDLFLQSAQKHTDLHALMNILNQEDGVLIRPFRKRTIHLIINNESTEGQSMFVSIHVAPSTAYMARVYQMADVQDERVSTLSLVLKAWKILDPQCVTAQIQSYHLMGMLIHFLQCGVSPPILPSLSLFYPHLDPSLYHSHPLPEPITCAKTFTIRNEQSPASLLIGFFTYFAHFEFDKYIISISEGRLLKRNVVGEGPPNKMMMEHPYDNGFKKKIGAYVFTDVDYDPIRSACKKALDSLTTLFNIPSLPSI